MTTGIKAPHCKLCGAEHWSYEPHKYPASLKPRPWAKSFVRSEPASVPVRKPVTARHETPATKQTFVTCSAQGCSNPLPVSATGRPGKYCSGTCRKRASRKK